MDALLLIGLFGGFAAFLYFSFQSDRKMKREEARKKFDQIITPLEKRAKQEIAEYSKSRFYPTTVVNSVKISPIALWAERTTEYLFRKLSENEAVTVTEIEELRNTYAKNFLSYLNDRMVVLEKALASPYPVSKPTVVSKPDVPNPFTEFMSGDDVKKAIKSVVGQEQKNSFYNKAMEIESQLKASYEEAMNNYKIAHERIEKKYSDAFAEWRNSEVKWFDDIKNEITQIENVKKQYLDEREVEKSVKALLQSAVQPNWIPNQFELKYDVESGILIIEQELRNFETYPPQKLAELKSGFAYKPLNKAEYKQFMERVYPLSALGIAINLALNIKSQKVKMIVFNGWINYRSKATGQRARAFCVSLAAETEKLRDIDLLYADPIVAFQSLKGNASRSIEVTPVAPISRISMEDKRYVDNKDVIDNLSTDQNLAAMDWEEFEHLCRELFERVFAREGATVKVTQASRDQGVDAVIIDPRPIHGGKTVVQAKRYVNTVDVSAVRDLYGTVNHEGANKGILVTTSHYGPDAYAFIAGKNLELINGAELLHILEEYGYRFRIDLNEARRLQKDDVNQKYRRN